MIKIRHEIPARACLQNLAFLAGRGFSGGDTGRCIVDRHIASPRRREPGGVRQARRESVLSARRKASDRQVRHELDQQQVARAEQLSIWSAEHPVTFRCQFSVGPG